MAGSRGIGKQVGLPSAVAVFDVERGRFDGMYLGAKQGVQQGLPPSSPNPIDPFARKCKRSRNLFSLDAVRSPKGELVYKLYNSYIYGRKFLSTEISTPGESAAGTEP